MREMKVPIISLYSLSIVLIATFFFILVFSRTIKKLKNNRRFKNEKAYATNSQQAYMDDINKSKFNIKILRVIRDKQTFKVYIVNKGEKLFHLQCEGIENSIAKLEIEEVDTDVDNNETSVILITSKEDEIKDVELFLKYFTKEKYHKIKRVRINLSTTEINLVE